MSKKAQTHLRKKEVYVSINFFLSFLKERSCIPQHGLRLIIKTLLSLPASGSWCFTSKSLSHIIHL